MPIKPSTKKALRVSRRKAARNLDIKKKLEGVLKKASPRNLNEVQSLLDRAAKKGVIHKRKAARLKSRLFKKFKVEKLEARKPVKQEAKKISSKKTTKSKTNIEH